MEATLLRTAALPWPFEAVVDARGRPCGWVVLHSHLRSPDRLELFAQLRRSGTRFLGMTSDGTFPAPADPGVWEPLDYAAICEGWAHCLREPERWLPDVSRTLLSAADFTDTLHVEDVAKGGSVADAFDFVYVGAPGAWKAAAKGWELAQRCLPVLAGELGLRGLLVDVDPAYRPADRRLTVSPPLPWSTLLGAVRRAGFLFAPNAADASPRVLAEALALDVPILVNRGILGGWHYVDRRTGLFFEDESDIGTAAIQLLAEPRSPRDWFRTNHGPYLAGRRLLELVSTLDTGLSESSHLLLQGNAEPAGPDQSR